MTDLFRPHEEIFNDLVVAQRGMSDAEVEHFLRTGEVPDLSKPADTPVDVLTGELVPPDERTIGDGEARLLLDGVTTIAADALVAAGRRWKSEAHPRDRRGRFIDKGAVVDLLSVKKPTVQHLLNAVNELDQDDWDNLKPDQRDRITEQVDKLPSGSKLADDAKAKIKGLGGATKTTPTKSSAAKTAPSPSGKLAATTAYRKHVDGTVVAESPDGGRRMRWNAGQKKYVVEKRDGDGWTTTDTLGKGAAYEDLKKPDQWVTPGTAAQPADKTAKAPDVTPDVTDPAPTTLAQGTPLKATAAYVKVDDGVTIARSLDDSRRLRWDEARRRFIAERRDGDSWTEVDALTKGRTYEQLKEPGRWVAPSAEPDQMEQTGANVEPPSSSLGTEMSSPVVEPATTAPTSLPAMKITDSKQRDAIESYRVSGFIKTNRQLRTGVKQYGIGFDTDEQIAALDTALKDNALDRDVILWRGVNIAPGDLTPGTVLSDKAFISTSLDQKQARHFAGSPLDANAPAGVTHSPTLLRISAPKGTSALNLGGGEREVLLPRDTKLEVENVIQDADGTNIVYAKVTRGKSADKTSASAAALITTEPTTGLSPQEVDELADALDEIRFARIEAVGETVPDTNLSQALSSGVGIGSDQVKWASREIDKKDSSFYPTGKPVGLFDVSMVALGARQGFADKPSLGTPDDVDAVVAAGGVELWRGVKDRGKVKATDITDEFRRGEYEPGTGIYGNGYYTSVSRDVAAQYANKKHTSESLVRMALKPNARVVDYEELQQHVKVLRGREELSDEIRFGWGQDPGHVALMLGYDAVRVRDRDDGTTVVYPNQYGGASHHDQYIILNRAALLVEDDATPQAEVGDVPTTPAVQSSAVMPSVKIPTTLNQALVDEYVKLAAKHAVRDQMYDMSAPKLTHEENMRMYDLNVEIGKQSDSTVRDRIDQLGQIEGALSAWRRDHGVTKKSSDVLKKELADEVRNQFAGKKIGLRVTAPALAAIIDSGRVKTQFETNTSAGWNSPSYRAKFEAQWFGIGQGLSPDDAAKVDPAKRPVYGYVMLDGVRPVGDVDSDRLSAYGSIQVVLKDDVRKRTTAMFGDSINDHKYGMPSPVDSPTWESFTPQPGYVPGAVASTSPLTQRTRDPSSEAFRKHTYAEAQVHGGVTTGDIEEVIFPTQPSAAQVKMLKAAGTKWRVVKSEVST